MDNVWIVAITSLATVIVTGGISIWSKYIDSEQKLKEHKLSIRSTYVLKKIEAGQVIVNENNARIRYLYDLKEIVLSVKSGLGNKELLSERLVKSRNFIDELVLGRGNNASLFYDLAAMHNVADHMVSDINVFIKLLDLVNWEYNKDYENDFSSVINVIDKLQSAYREMSKFIRDDLAKYDII